MADKKDFTEKQKQIARIAKALSHPARVYIIQRLLAENRCNGIGCCTSGEMIDDIPIARSTLSQHLKELKYAGLIQGEIEPPKIKYCLNLENWQLAQQYFNELFNEKKDF
ncbi:MAG: helix-turn-helix transcriptional regulator [Bacteroidales bacterium]|nr:helix-turn-helix transcriptional regulator [Bacteroidales bacterium]